MKTWLRRVWHTVRPGHWAYRYELEGRLFDTVWCTCGAQL